MAIICPTVTADNTISYREEMERAAALVDRLHIDLADGQLAPKKLVNPIQAWWPEDKVADLHVMYQKPREHLETLISLKPRMIVLHAEADGDFMALAKEIKSVGILVGIALLPKTKAELLLPVLNALDHVLIFSGDLGYHGGHADLNLLSKVKELKAAKPNIEIGWDGGINDENASELVYGGVDVLNVGGFIQNAKDPAAAYATLKVIAEYTNR